MNFATLISYDRFCREERQIENSVQNTAEGKEFLSLGQQLKSLKEEKTRLIARKNEIETEISKYQAEYQKLEKRYADEAEDAARMQSYDESASDDEEKTESAEYKECREALEKIRRSVKSLAKKIGDMIEEYDNIKKRYDEVMHEGASKVASYETAKKRFSTVKNAQKPRLESIRAKKSAAEATLKEKEELLWSKYQSIAAEKSDPLAVIDDGRCSGCGIALPKNTAVRVSASELVICENCGRIIIQK